MKRILLFFLMCVAAGNLAMADEPMTASIDAGPTFTACIGETISVTLTAHDVDIQCGNIVYDYLYFDVLHIGGPPHNWTSGDQECDELLNCHQTFTLEVEASSAGQYRFRACDLNHYAGEDDQNFEFIVTVLPKTVIYVKPGGTGDGSSWTYAEDSVEHALTLRASSGDEIWVAGDSEDPYEGNITLKSGVGLYGGFDATESYREDRDWRENTTTLDDADHSGSVVTSPEDAGSDTVIDGFTIKNGRAAYGGGISCVDSSPTIANNVITSNTAHGDEYGGGGGGGYIVQIRTPGSPTTSLARI